MRRRRKRVMERVGGLGGLWCAAQVMSTKKQPLSFWSP
jgi:hypothetical protein